VNARQNAMSVKNQRDKWMNNLYPVIERGSHSIVRNKQRAAFMMGYERAILDMKAKLWQKVLEEDNAKPQ
jgi:hypothetical protein